MAREQSVLVTGAGGFIGGGLVADFVSRGIPVRAVDKKPLSDWSQCSGEADNVVADLAELDVCRKVVQGVHGVYNLAADMGGMGFIENNKALCMLSVLINTHLLLAAREEGVERFFFSSSACVYAADKQKDTVLTALVESDAYPAMPEDGYGWEKLFSERMCRHFNEDFGLVTRVARFHNVYGPYGTFDGGREKAPAAICRKVSEAVLSGNSTIEIWGDGEQTRSFMYIDDCVKGVRLISEGEFADAVNLGSSELVSINELVSIVESIAGVKLDRVYDLSAPQGVRGRNSDNRLMLDRYGWEPSTSLRDGLESTYSWIFDQVRAGRSNTETGERSPVLDLA
jgi:GDP-D-mannose 3',5'-epimerase